MTDIFPHNTVTLSISAIFAFTLLSSVLLKFWLTTRQIRHVARHRTAVPDAFVNKISLQAHQKAANYTLTKARCGLLELAWDTAITLTWTLLGCLSLFNQWLLLHLGSGLVQQVALFAGFVAINALAQMPFTVYQTFGIEQRFGFNKTTGVLWLKDLFKSMVLTTLMGIPLAALILWVMGTTGSVWWLWAWGVWVTFNLLALLVYPRWIAPWFNQFKPLEDPELQTRVRGLLERCGYKSQGVFVMDGSKRSAHTNAYFTGFGTSKRVVLYDTLLAQLTPTEIEAVLAHELGHLKHQHIFKRLAWVFGMSLLGFAALGWLSQHAWFYLGLGAAPSLTGANDALAVLLFTMVLPIVGIFLGPWFAHLSRKHEFQADAYAVTHTNKQALACALLKLYEDNASTLTPDPMYAKFYYSHPAATERLARIHAMPMPAVKPHALAGHVL